jgi:tetratricopeptide (TPR) repeat protein
LEARLGLASSLYRTGNADGAEKLYRQLLEQYPNNVRILNDLAWILQEHYQRYAEALGLANRGLNLSPRNLHLLDTRAAIFLHLPDRLADARKDFERIVELTGADAGRQTKSLLLLGRICVKLNDVDAAKRHLQRALEMDQKSNVLTTEERSEIDGVIR